MLFKRKEKEKAPRGLRTYFRKNPRENRHRSWTYYFILALIIIFALNVTFLLPPQLSSIFYELEIWLISFLRTPITQQTWFWIVAFASAVLGGYFAVPILTIPSTKEHYIVIDTWIEGELKFFKTLSGKVLAIHRDVVKSFSLHSFVFYPVSRTPFEDYILYQTSGLEVTKSILAERLAAQLAEENAVLREMLKRYEPYLSMDDVKILMSRGVSEE